jgi:protein O-mannosyl-transferase
MATQTVVKQGSSLSSRRRYWWLAGLAVVYAGLVYLNALQNPYVYDDNRTVLNNQSIEDVTNLQRIVLRESMRPLVNFSYAVDRAVWPWELVGHHLTSVLLHMANVLLLFHLAWVATEDRQQATGARHVSPAVVAFITAGLFGLHPMMTEAVAYISGRSEVLYTFFFLLALLAARRWMRREGRIWLLAASVLWIAAVLSKEVAVFWPLIAALYDRYVLGSPAPDWRRRFMRVYLPLLLVTAAAGIIRIGILVLVENPDSSRVMWRFGLVEVVVAFRYLMMLIVPTGQSIFHQVDDVTSVTSPLFIGAVVWLVVWLWGAWKLREQDGVAALGLIWFVLLLVPSALLVLLDLGEPMAEHRVYLASAGVFMAVATAFGHSWAFFETRKAPSRIVLRVLLAMWLTILGAQTVLRNTVWATPVRLWADAVRQAPDVWVPHLILGESLQNENRHEEAVVEYRRAIALRPTEPVGYMKLGLCLAELRRLDDAAAAFTTLEKLSPGSLVARNGLGAVAVLAGRYDEARRYYQSALTAHPDDVAARQSLAMLAEQVDHNPAEALRFCEEVARIAPDTPGNDDCLRRNRKGATSQP